MKNKARFWNKVYRKINWFLFRKLDAEKWGYLFYASYRHRNHVPKEGADPRTVYMTQIPNEGAGIGHQLANYISGYHYSKMFSVPFAYPGFRDKDWEEFLGFGENEVSIRELKKRGYKFRRIPYFNGKEKSIELTKKIVASYAGEKVILCTELHQFYANQYEEIPHIKYKFESAEIRKKDSLIFRPEELNVAIHIRRGDIVIGQESGEQGLTKRWLTMDYYTDIAKGISEKTEKKPHFYIFSQGTESEYKVFEKYGKVTYCLDMLERESFLHMVRADILVMSKSSFSYNPALLSDGIRICPSEFWHGYPSDEKWIIVDEVTRQKKSTS